MKKLTSVLGVFVLIVGMLGASFLISPQQAQAATSKNVTVKIYKSSEVTRSDSTLKSYVTFAMGKIDDAASDVTLNVTVNNPIAKSWSDCYSSASASPGIVGDPSNDIIAVNYYDHQLHCNGYGDQETGRASVDLNVAKFGKTCTGDSKYEWYEKKLVTHEIGHVFGAEDRCLYDAGVMDKCGGLYATHFGNANSTLINDYLKNDW